MIAVACGARVVAVDVAPAALELAARFGAEAVVNAGAGALVRDVVPGGVQLSLDALGSEATCAASVAGLARRGRHVQVGLLPPGLGLPRVPMHLVVAGELEILGSHGMSARSYPRMLGLIASGRLDPGALVTRTVTLAEAGPLLAAMGDHSPVGVVVARP
jgi:alcohol dehydrogenase